MAQDRMLETEKAILLRRGEKWPDKIWLTNRSTDAELVEILVNVGVVYAAVKR
jgi:hypothetical protein